MVVLQSTTIKTLAEELGADTVGIAKAEPVQNIENFQTWLNNGYAGEMTYMNRYQEERFNPEKLLPGARSIIVIGLNYSPTSNDNEKKQSPFRVARYAWGEDYHNVLRRMLRRLRTRLKSLQPKLRGRICVDTAPFMDKYWAQKAGLGWQGKHSNLVSRKFGNWLLIGSLIINIGIDKYDKPHSNHCGKCTACIDACPTKAIIAPYQLNATRCISYWTIESKKDHIPDDIRKNLNNIIFGCDICLEVCPFNKFEKPRRENNLKRLDETGLLENGKAANLSKEQFNTAFTNSPISRPGLSGIKRNIKACRGLMGAPPAF
jgi:epoxyqueuosine reductase